MNLPDAIAKIAPHLGVHSDKVLHAIAGVIAGLFGLMVALAFSGFSVNAHTHWWLPLLMAAGAGVTKEASDAITNQRMTGSWRGDPIGQPHGVEALDALVTAAPGLLISMAIHAFMGG